MRMQLVPEVGRPDFLDLPWEQPLAGWTSERLVEVVSGIHRHVVRFVDYGGALYVLKELPQRLAEREYRLLRALGQGGEPVVEAVGIVVERPDELDGVLVTRYLDFSLPYRILLRDGFDPAETDRVLDAFAELLVRLHLAGFFWGDCSLSNTLFRRDAGALSAYLVDAETGELHGQVSDGQRRYDLDIAEENFAGELFDLAAERGRDPCLTRSRSPPTCARATSGSGQN